MEAIHYYNGQYLKKNEISISPDDVGFLRGYGVFDFFRVEEGIPIFLDDHLDRLVASAQGIGIEMTLTRKELEVIIYDLIKKNGLPVSSIKIFLTGGLTIDGFTPSEPTILILNQPFSEPQEGIYKTGASLMLYNYQRDFPTVKSTQYVKALELQKAWQKDGHIDVLYHNGEYISEVSRSSVFIFKNGVLKTNKKEVLKGITQTNVLRALKKKFPIEVGDIKLNEVLNADEMFITSTTKRILPIIKVGEQLIGKGKIGELTNEAIQEFSVYVKDYINQHRQ